MSYTFFPFPTPVFPALSPLAWPVNKKPSFTSSVNTAISSKEIQLIRSAVPIWDFTLSYGGESWLRDQTQNIAPQGPRVGYTELEQLSGLFLQCLGSYGEFYYSDPQDYMRNGIPVGVGDGTTTTFNILIPYGVGPFYYSFTMPVGGVEAISQIYFETVPESPSYTFNTARTQIIFSSAPDAGISITMDLTFYFRCRFTNDLEEFDQIMSNLWEKKELKFRSVKQ